MVRRPVVSSIRSRQTGQVGSSTRFGVGGGKGLRKVDVGDGANGSSAISWKFVFGEEEAGVWKVIDFTKMTLHVSGY